MFSNPYTEITITTASRLAYALGVSTADVLEDVEDEVYREEIAAIKAKRKATSANNK